MSIVSWLPIAIFAYLLAAFNGVIDRAIIHKEQTRPIVISFWVALFSIATSSLVLIGYLPFNFAGNFRFEYGTLGIMSLALMSGFLTQLGLLLMYRALRYGEVTRVLAVMGGLSPLVSFAVAYIFLGERLSGSINLSFFILIFATIVLTLNPKKLQHKSFSKWVINITTASLVFGAQAVLAKYVYDNYQFISAYSMGGLGAGVYVFVIALLSKNVRREMLGIVRRNNYKNSNSSRSKQIYWIIGNSLVGGISVICLNLAISKGSPTLVSALRGVQYAGIFIIAILLAKFYPKLLAEDLTKKSVFLKIAGICMTIIGITLLAISI